MPGILNKRHVMLPVAGASVRLFETGSLGYSETEARRHLDGVRLITEEWSVGALAIERVRSTFFDDVSRFPRGGADLDCALVMRDLAHEWRSAPDFPLERAG